MSSSKNKRTITVEKSSSDGNVKSKPSVFERLGAPHSFSSSERQEICLDFAKNGTCNYGSKCKYSHVTPRRDRERDRGSDDLRNRVSRKRDENESDPEAKKSLGQRKEKDSKIKSTVVVTKSTENIEDIWPEPSGDADKGSVDRKHESKSRQQGSASSHGTEGDGHKASKQDIRLDDKKDDSAVLQSSSSKTKNKSPSHGDDDSSRRKSKDKKKKKRNRSQGSRSPDKAEDKQDQKHQKDPVSSSKSSSDKHSKSVTEPRKAESSSGTTGLPSDRSSEKKLKPKEEKNKSVENRLIMLAMESETKLDTARVGRVRSPGKSKRELSPAIPPPPQGKGKDTRKDYTSPSSRTKDARKERIDSPPKSKKSAKERSVSPTRPKDVRRDRSISPSRSKDHGTKSSHSKSQIMPLPVSSRASDKSKPTFEEKPLEQSEKRDSGLQKPEKVKASRKRRRSSTSSASSSSSSSSGSDSGSSSGSSSSGSSSSSSYSSDDSSDERKPTKERRGKDPKLAVGRRSDTKPVRPDDEKGSAKAGDHSKKEKERTPQDEARARQPGDEKDKNRTLETTKHGHTKKGLSPGRGRKKDWEKGGLRPEQDTGFDSRTAKASTDLDKAGRDSLDRSGTGEPSRQKTGDAAEYSRKARSPMTKDDRGKPVTPADMSRHGQSPAESLRSHHSAKPVQDQERDLEGQSSSGQYRDYYSSREKSGRKDDDRYQQYDELYAKKHQDRADPRSQSYSSHKHHSTDPYDRSREATDIDRDDRDSRYSRDHGYEGDRYAISSDRHHPEVGEESRSRQDYYSSSYRDDRRSGRTDDFGRKEPDRMDKHTSSYETRDSERDYDTRDREKGRDQRAGDYREKPRGDAIEHSSSSKYKKDGPLGQEGPLDESRRERTSRRGQWESEREADDQARQMTGRSDPSRGYGDKREVSRKRPLEEDGGSGRSPSAKKMREGSPSESHHSFSSRTAYDRDAERLDKERDRSQRGRNVGRDDDRHSIRGEGEYRDKGRSDRDRIPEKDWESSRRHDSKDRSKDLKAVAEGRERGSDIKESWHSRDESHKRRRSLEKTGSDRDGWERGKDWKRSRIDPEVEPKTLQLAERDKPVERGSRRDEDHRGSTSRDRSPKSSSYAYKLERTEGDKRSSDSLGFVKSIEADVETRTGRVKSEEKRDLVVKDAEPSMIPVHVDDRMRRSQSRGSRSSKHSQRDRDPRRDDRHYDDRFDLYSRDSHYRDERLPVPERSYDHEDREPWVRDRSYDRIRPEDDAGRPHRGAPFNHDRGERDVSKSRDFSENDWESDSFIRDNLGYRGIPRLPNWERDRPRDEWENRYDRGLEPDYRARREVLLPPPPRPRPAPEVMVPSPLPPPVEPVVVPPPVEHPPVLRTAEVKPEHATPTKSGRGSKDEDTGYDDISDGELDDLIGVVEEDKEENQVKKTGVVDILDIKWESLIQNNHEKPPVPSSVLNRFRSSAIFRRIGVSRAFAGNDLLDQVKTVCQKQLEDEDLREIKEEKKETEEQPAEPKTEESEKPVVKEEPEDIATGKSSSPVKEEVQAPPAKATPVKFQLLDDIADFHAGLQLKSTERIGIVTNVGPYRRALCARRDLAIRRGLCKVEKEDILMFPTHVVDQDLYKQSLQLFHHDRTVEKKLALGSSAPQRLHPVSAA